MPRGASLTAEWVCLLRALERARPEPRRILDDPFAERFLRPSQRALLRAATRPMPLRAAPLDWSLLPFADFVAARHRYMDDALRAAVGDGITQVVLLGAGYDTRAWRLADALGERVVWEVDFPATQARKRAVLADDPELRSDRVRFVPVDFTREDFVDGLVDHGFPVGRRTLFIWEGVSMYLDRDTVARTLDALRELGGAGSRIVADFWHEPRGPRPWVLAQTVGARLFGVIGEPLRFQVPQHEAGSLLARHGFRLDELVDTAALAARYRHGRRFLYAPLFLAHATAV
ncbi:MAG: SAM-dependent methyltransferase [Deltaproteobacteria bacterium]|nr:MAG: SAM-dependent methyltransferase [Deltaproteobacteria bacterium]